MYIIGLHVFIFASLTEHLFWSAWMVDLHFPFYSAISSIIPFTPPYYFDLLIILVKIKNKKKRGNSLTPTQVHNSAPFKSRHFCSLFMGRMKWPACHLHTILCTWDAATTSPACTPVSVFFPLGVWLCIKKNCLFKSIFCICLLVTSHVHTYKYNHCDLVRRVVSSEVGPSK